MSSESRARAVPYVEAAVRDREWLLDPERSAVFVELGGLDHGVLISRLRGMGVLPAAED